MSRILDSINSPSDLKSLRLTELEQLAQEIREELIFTVVNNGGHLASNLGVVELTIALHRVFDSPRDKIIWDVGHQSYVHKLLTGRRERFSTIRQFRGLSGFTERSESVHDVFGTGHASTSVSAALGMAIARDLAGEDNHVIAVIGDGSLTGGMALEALNHAGHLGVKIVVILNDNNMAISPNVGALSKSLSRLRLDPRYHRAKKGAARVFSILPLGEQMWQVGKRVKNTLKGFFVPTMLWEELGFTYMGPIDGHNLAELEAALIKARNYSFKPAFVHIQTVKGKGHDGAEEDPVTFHGLAPLGEKKSSAPTYTRVFAQSALKLFSQEPRLVAITAAMLEGTGLSLVARQFPQRVFDVGVCEQHAVTLAAGLATQGFIPIVAIYSTFLQRAFDQVIHDVCLQNLPVVFVLDRGGIVGEDGKTHQGIFDLSYLSCIPNMIVAAPANENELQHLLYTAVKANAPIAIRYPRGNGIGVALDPEFQQLPIGKGEVLRRGSDVAILGIGATVVPCLEAASALAGSGVDCAVVNARFVKPLDADLILKTAAETQRLVTVEENVLAGGFGSAVMALLEQRGLSEVKVKCLGLPDGFVEHGSQETLRAQYGLDSRGITRHILESFPELRETAHRLLQTKKGFPF